MRFKSAFAGLAALTFSCQGEAPKQNLASNSPNLSSDSSNTPRIVAFRDSVDGISTRDFFCVNPADPKCEKVGGEYTNGGDRAERYRIKVYAKGTHYPEYSVLGKDKLSLVIYYSTGRKQVVSLPNVPLVLPNSGEEMTDSTEMLLDFSKYLGKELFFSVKIGNRQVSKNVSIVHP